MPSALVGLGLFACAPHLEGGSEPGAGRCPAPALAIHDIQGYGPASAFVGRVVSVQGVVTAQRMGDAGAGFFIQSVTPDADARSSEGLFVALGAHQAAPAVGRRVSVRGEVRELEAMTQLHAIELIQECGDSAPRPTRIASGAAASRLDGMWVRLEETWTLIDTWRLPAHGEVSASRVGRLYAPGHELGQPAERDAELRWAIQDSSLQSVLLSSRARACCLRLGAELHEPVGVVDFASGRPRLLATQPLEWAERAPPALPPASPELLRLASLNLGNYFVRVGARGAASELELSRQRQKLAAALLSLDADLLALTELENRGQASIEHLIAGLDEVLPPERRYTWSAALPAPQSDLRAALLYRPGRVRALGEARFDPDAAFTRPPLFQSFRRGQTTFTVGVVHLKSKRCDAGPVVVGPEGCNAETRLKEAAALVQSVLRLHDASKAGVLLVGDFNSDPLEGPLLELRRSGFVDLLDALPDEERYSYVFEGYGSLLDHALATPELALARRRANIWHINADEPGFRSYRLDNPPAEYQPDAFRSSDHDPVLVDLAL